MVATLGDHTFNPNHNFCPLALFQIKQVVNISNPQPVKLMVKIVFLRGDDTELSQAIVRGSGADRSHVAQGDEIPLFDHVGLQVDNDVIEAGFYTGVVATPFGDFTGRAPGFLAMDLPAAVDAEAAARRARSSLGMGYNRLFTRGLRADPPVLYCSELIREACLRADGSYYFRKIPLNFCDATGKLLPYWEAHYRVLNAPVPQGQPGTSPLSIYRDLLLPPED